MSTKLAKLKDCAVLFLGRAAANLHWYYTTYYFVEEEMDFGDYEMR